ncbi:Rtr1/RPAP2 family-domain-containing protein [Annulohypoxylon bovei var. microspora]|nr:Rtr1/RPAP2 family-domain-containing protein [Annulohypoxylon bovei var. microspora]
MSSPAPTQAKQPKSILKKPSAFATPRAPPTTTAAAPVLPFPLPEHEPEHEPDNQPEPEPKPASEKKPTARDLAIQQALLIQAQRDQEDQIQDTIISLARLPSPPSSTPQTPTAAHPSPHDATLFLSSVRLFQPSEYEDLIVERNALGKCGYCLCPSPRTKLRGGGSFKLLNYGRADFSIVPRAELERWCSRACARRAMYVKVQLSETAAAERAGVPSIRIELLDEEDDEKPKPKSKAKPSPSADDSKGEKEDGAAARVARELRSLEERERKAARDAKELALERGDKDSLPSTTKPVTVTIREKKVIIAAQEPSLDTDDESHLVLDGYKTKFDPAADEVDTLIERSCHN